MLKLRVVQGNIGEALHPHPKSGLAGVVPEATQKEARCIRLRNRNRIRAELESNGPTWVRSRPEDWPRLGVASCVLELWGRQSGQ